MTKPRKTQIVVVGGGAGGLELATRLGARFGRDAFDIILVEKNRTHIWKPLLHEVAAGSLDANLDEILASGYSVSVFSDWTTPRRHQIWRKRRADPDVPTTAAQSWYSAVLADTPRNPVNGMPPEHATAQLGEFGPWNERLPHFRLDFTPSSGEELQTEYLLPRQHAVAAFRSLDDIAARIAEVVQVSELRTVAAGRRHSPAY